MISVGEINENKWDGKVTVYQPDGVIKNLIIEYGELTSRGSVFAAECVYFGSGQPYNK